MKIGVFLGLLGETYLNAALPQLMEVLSVPADRVQWLTSAYMLTMEVCVPMSAYAIKRVTAKQLYGAALSLLLFGSLLCPFAASFPLILFGRVVQAIGASMMLPLMMHSIMVAYEPKDRGRAMGSAMLVVLFAPALGPTFGGFVYQVAGWRCIFLSVAPVIIGAMLHAGLKMNPQGHRSSRNPDVISSGLSSVGFLSFIYGVQQLVSKAEISLPIITGIVLGFCLLFLFSLRQLHLAEPMLDIRVFKKKVYTIGVVVITLTHMTMFANFILIPIFLVNMLDVSAFVAGLLVLPGRRVGAVVPRMAGRLYDRIGPKIIVGAGFVLLASMNFLMAILPMNVPAYLVMLLYMFLMSGVGSILTPTQTHSLNQLDRIELPHGTAIMNTLMHIGASMGASFFVGFMSVKTEALLQSGTSGILALLGGIHYSYYFATAFSVVGFLLSTQLSQGE